MVTLKDPKHLEGCLCAQTVNSLLLLKRQREHHAGFESGLPKHAHSICLYVQKEYTLKQKGYGKRASLSYKNSCRELAVSHLKVGCAVDVGLCCGTRQGTDAGVWPDSEPTEEPTSRSFHLCPHLVLPGLCPCDWLGAKSLRLIPTELKVNGIHSRQAC